MRETEFISSMVKNEVDVGLSELSRTSGKFCRPTRFFFHGKLWPVSRISRTNTSNKAKSGTCVLSNKDFVSSFDRKRYQTGKIDVAFMDLGLHGL